MVSRMDNIETMMMLDRVINSETRYTCKMTSLICNDDLVCTSEDGSDYSYNCPFCWVEEEEGGWVNNYCMIEDFQEEYMEEGIIDSPKVLR